jgi:SAM-dependent methyltransferase
MLDTLTGWIRRVARGLRVAVIIPVGPGHESLYTECRASVERAWRRGRGPFVAMSLIDVDDTGGRLGRSRARNIGIERAVAGRADWMFFLDADDLMTASAFDTMSAWVDGYDAVWGLILGISPAATAPQLRIPQIIGMDSFNDLLLFEPFLTLQMGHFVRASVAAAVRFDESMDAGEDFDYYVRLWSAYRCRKIAREFFINRHGLHSKGPRAATAEDWVMAVRSRQRREREKHQLDANSDMALGLRNQRTAELHRFCRLQGLVGADQCVALSRKMPFFGEIEIDEYQGGMLILCDDGADPVCARLAWTGEYQSFASSLWQSLLADGGTVLDIGAGDGFYALLAARALAPTRVVCIEHDDINEARLRRNVARNAADNIDLLAAFLEDINACLSEADVTGLTAIRIGAGYATPEILSGLKKTVGDYQPDVLLEMPAPLAVDLYGWLKPRHYHCYVIAENERELRRCDPADAAGACADGYWLLTARSPQALIDTAGFALGRYVQT